MENKNLNKKMGGYPSSNSDPNYGKLYDPYDKLVVALDLKDYELDIFNRPVCLTRLNFDFQYVLNHLYILLCEEKDQKEKVRSIMMQRLPPFGLLTALIQHARLDANFTTDELLDICCSIRPETSELFSKFKTEPGKIYILEYGIMSSHPKICNWMHPHLPIGSMISDLNLTLEMLTGISDPEKLFKICDIISNLEGGKRFYDLSEFKFRNGVKHAVLYNEKYHIMCTTDVQLYYFFLSMLPNAGAMESLRDWLKELMASMPRRCDIVDRTSVIRVKIHKKGKSTVPSDDTLSDNEAKGSGGMSEAKRKDAKGSGGMSEAKGKEAKGKEVEKREEKGNGGVSVPKISKRKSIPSQVRHTVWTRHFDGFKGTCWVCKSDIEYKSWHCGHIIADAKGGLPTADNLVPTCSACNLSMGNMSMYDYIARYHPVRLVEIGWKPGHYPVH